MLAARSARARRGERRRKSRSGPGGGWRTSEVHHGSATVTGGSTGKRPWASGAAAERSRGRLPLAIGSAPGLSANSGRADPQRTSREAWRSFPRRTGIARFASARLDRPVPADPPGRSAPSSFGALVSRGPTMRVARGARDRAPAALKRQGERLPARNLRELLQPQIYGGYAVMPRPSPWHDQGERKRLVSQGRQEMEARARASKSAPVPQRPVPFRSLAESTPTPSTGPAPVEESWGPPHQVLSPIPTAGRSSTPTGHGR